MISPPMSMLSMGGGMVASEQRGASCDGLMGNVRGGERKGVVVHVEAANT